MTSDELAVTSDELAVNNVHKFGDSNDGRTHHTRGQHVVSRHEGCSSVDLQVRLRGNPALGRTRAAPIARVPKKRFQAHADARARST